jgi:hypothetical protein
MAPPGPPQVHAKIPDDAWEYQIRKALNDAAYNGLDYVPYCSTMPVQANCKDPKFMWVSVEPAFGGGVQAFPRASRGGPPAVDLVEMALGPPAGAEARGAGRLQLQAQPPVELRQAACRTPSQAPPPSARARAPSRPQKKKAKH